MESGRHKQVLDQEEPEECSQDERENDHPPARLGEETIRTWSRVDSVISQILHDWAALPLSRIALIQVSAGGGSFICRVPRSIGADSSKARESGGPTS